jgi:hypothetical protein
MDQRRDAYVYVLVLCSLILLGGCGTLDLWEKHPFIAPDKVLLTGSGYAGLVSTDPRPIAVDAVPELASIRAFQLAPGPHTVVVDYRESQEAKKRCQVAFDFRPGKRYRVIKSSLDSNGELKLVFDEKWGVWLTEHNSSVVLAQCR